MVKTVVVDATGDWRLVGSSWAKGSGKASERSTAGNRGVRLAYQWGGSWGGAGE